MAGCVGMLGDVEECEPQALTIDGLETDIQCCDTDRCNVGIKGKLEFYIQSTLVISKSKEPSETLRDIRTSTYQMCRTEENTNRTNKFHK